MIPKRIQRSRKKGWRLPENAVYVGRPSQWGNPYRVGVRTAWQPPGGVVSHIVPVRAQDAVEAYRVHIDRLIRLYTPFGLRIRSELGGRDLACWCPLVDENGEPVPCHADVLLELANPPAEGGAR